MKIKVFLKQETITLVNSNLMKIINLDLELNVYKGKTSGTGQSMIKFVNSLITNDIWASLSIPYQPNAVDPLNLGLDSKAVL